MSAPQWVEAQSTAHIFDWGINEVRLVDLGDSETIALISAGLLVVLDEETRKSLPAPQVPYRGGCGCGQ